MNKQQVTESELLQSLSNLQDLLKSQIVTGGGSSKGNLADMHPEVLGDTWDDGIAQDGTDYNGGGKRASKAHDDEDDDGKMPYARRNMADEDDDDDDDDDDEKEEKALPVSGESGKAKMSAPRQYPGEAKKSLSKACKAHGDGGCPKNCPNYGPGGKGEDMSKMAPAIRPSVGFGRSLDYEDNQDEEAEVRKGVEVSDFLYYLNKSIRDTFSDMEQRMVTRMDAHHAERGEFAKALAEGVTGIHGELCKSMNVVEEEENAPAYEAKSVTKSVEDGQVSSMKKSLDDARVQRQSILDELFGLLEKGQVSPLDVTKFELYGNISPELAKSLNLVNA